MVFVRSSRLIALAMIVLGAMNSAEASIVRVFDPYYGSSNSPATGATARMEMVFTDVGDDVRLTLNITNTTGSVTSLFGTPTAGATESKLTGIAFDLPVSVVIVPSSYVWTSYFPVLMHNVSMAPFGVFDEAVADNSNFLGGNPNNALSQGLSTSVSLKLSTALTAAQLESAWASDTSLRYGARFQAVNAGEGSDKLLGGAPPLPPPPPPPDPPVTPDTHVPEPASLTLLAFGALGLAVAQRRRRSA